MRPFAALAVFVCLGTAHCGSSSASGSGADASDSDGTTSRPDGGFADSPLTGADGGLSDRTGPDGGSVPDATPTDANDVHEGGFVGDGSLVDLGESVLMHHKNPSRDGVYVQPALTKTAAAGLKVDTAFSAALPDPNDQVYAQPLYVVGASGGPDRVIVATEANNVYALDATTGAQSWSKNLGPPIPRAMMQCGNIMPNFGITGTPVIDLASRTLFVTAAVGPTDAGVAPTYEIFALSVDTGLTKTGWPIDVGAKLTTGTTTFDTTAQGQRGALAIVNGTLYVAFGGLFGDCGAYHGWVVAVSISDPTQLASWKTTAAAGGVWAPGGVSSDGNNIYVSTGNTQGATA